VTQDADPVMRYSSNFALLLAGEIKDHKNPANTIGKRLSIAVLQVSEITIPRRLLPRIESKDKQKYQIM
jgi:hypothetical protein